MSSTSTTEARKAAPLVLVVGLPGAVLVVATALMFVALPFGVDPLWTVEPLSLPEAAALRDNGEVVRQINGGADPNAPAAVRTNMLDNDAPVVVTPLEAAVGSDRADMIETLVDHGAVLDAATWTRLMCFAHSIDAGDAAAALEARRPAGASTRCEAVDTPW